MDTAPNFCLKDQDDVEHCLEKYRGKWVFLYFYPKDDTPGCTTEAQEIRDAWDEFSEFDVVVLGVSKDTAVSHQKFKEKYDLPFPLLADTEKEVAAAYGVLKEKNMFGKKSVGVSRESFLIDPEGSIVRHYKKVKPGEHAQEVLEDLKELTR